MSSYIGNKNTMKYHRSDSTNSNCQLEEIEPEHKKYFSDKREAEAEGFEACDYCRP